MAVPIVYFQKIFIWEYVARCMKISVAPSKISNNDFKLKYFSFILLPMQKHPPFHHTSNEIEILGLFVIIRIASKDQSDKSATVLLGIYSRTENYKIVFTGTD